MKAGYRYIEETLARAGAELRGCTTGAYTGSDEK